MTELRDSVRALAKTPGLSLIVILTLALGIGATTTIFDLANAFHWRKPAVRDPGSLVEVYTTGRQPAFGPYGALSWPDYEDYRDSTKSFTGLASSRDFYLNLETPAGARETLTTAVSGNYFEVLGLAPALGRLLLPSDDLPGAEPVAVLGYSQWRDLGADPDLVGRTVRLAGASLTLIGVAPEEFTGTMTGNRPGLYFPNHLGFELFDSAPDSATDRGVQEWWILGRLAPGTTRQSAAAELSIQADRLDREEPIPNFDREIHVLPVTMGHPVDQFRMRATFRVFGAAVGLLLLIVCANVANLLLSKASPRLREMGIRQSLGADRGALLRLLMVENTLLALAGAGVGLLLALAIRKFLLLFFGPEFTGDIRFDFRVLGLTLMTALTSTLIFGLLPAVNTVRVDLVAALKGAPLGTAGRSHHRGRAMLAIAQVALSLILLVCSGLLIRNLNDLRTIDRGFEHDGLLLARVDVEQARYQAAGGRQLFRHLFEQAASIPSVLSAGSALLIPPILFDANTGLLLPEDPETIHPTRFNITDGGYFDTLGLRLEEGRVFDPREVASDRGVVVVNRLLADKLWPDGSALGRIVRTDRARPGDPGTDYEVIGVVSSLAWYALSRDPEPVVYFSWEQRFRSSLFAVLRTTGGEPESIFAALRQELRELDPGLALTVTKTHDDHRAGSLVVQRMQTQTLSLFGATGLLLALLGVFAVMSYSVSQQIREIGIRMAVGASQVDVLRWVLGRGLVLSLSGLGAGLLGSFWAVRLLQRIVEGNPAVDPWVVAGAAALLLAASTAAAWLPARRASKLDPLLSLRQD